MDGVGAIDGRPTDVTATDWAKGVIGHCVRPLRQPTAAHMRRAA